MKKFFYPQTLILLLILGAATFLNFYHLKERNLVFFTEAEYLLEANFILHLSENLSFIRSIMDEERIGPPEGRLFGKPLDVGKPLHTLFVALLSLLIGLKDYTGLYLSAIFGVATVCLTYIIGKSFYGEKVALLASTILALMPYQIMYSRSGFPETDSVFLFYLGILFYFYDLRTYPSLNRRYLALASLIIGLSLISNLRWIIFLPFLLLFEICLVIKEMNLKLLFRRLIILFGCLLIPVLIPEVLYATFKLFCPLPEGMLTYFEQVVRAFGFVTGKENDIRSFWLYFYFLWKLVGPVGLLLLIFAGWSLKEEFSKETLFLLLIVVIPIFTYSFFSISRAPRNLSISLPAIAILMAKGTVNLYSLRPNYLKPFSIGLIILALLLPGVELQRILGLRSNHKEALQYMLTRGNLKHFSTARMVSLFYVDRRFILWPPNDIESMKRLWQDYGFRFLWVDWKRYAWGCEVIKDVESRIKPCYTISQNVGDYWAHLYENEYATYRSNEYVKEVLKDKDLGKIKIYDLEEFFSKEEKSRK